MSNSSPSSPARRLPVAPPKIGGGNLPPLPGNPKSATEPAKPSPVEETQAKEVTTSSIPKLSAANTGKGNKSNGVADSFTDVFQDETDFFGDVPRTLTVNEQPFFRWFKRVSLALIITSVFLLAVTLLVKAPLEVGLTTIAAVWVIVLAFSLPEALIPFKKTKFDLTDNTVRVGQKKPVPISDIKHALFTTKKKNSKLWLGFDNKNGFFVPIKSSKFVMKKEDLLALRTVVPHTSVTPFGNMANLDTLEGNVNKAEVTQQEIVEHIEKLIIDMK